MAEIKDLNVTAANNTGRFPNGVLVAQVNDSARELEAMLAREFKDTTGQLATLGTADAYRVILNRYIVSYTAGCSFKVRFHIACVDDPYLEFNAIGYRLLCRQNGTNIKAGDIVANQIVQVDYNSAWDKFVCLGIGDSTQSQSIPQYTVATLPAVSDKRLILVTNETGGAVTAFSDGTNWRRTTDRAIVS